MKEKKVLKLIKKDFSIEEWLLFSDDIKKNELVIEKLVEKLNKMSFVGLKDLCQKNPFLIKWLPDQTQKKLANDDNFCYLKENLQMIVIKKDDSKVALASDCVQRKFVEENPEKISKAKLEIQRQMAKNNLFYLEMTDENVQVEFANKDIDNLCYCSNLVQCGFIKIDPNNYKKCSSEVRKEIISLKMLSANTVSIDTIDSYLISKYNNISISELKKFKDEIEKSNRDDKRQVIDYMNYMIVNLEKGKRM